MKDVRLFTISADGLTIDRLELVFNDIRVFEDFGMGFTLDRYHNTQLDLTHRIAEYKRQLMSGFTGTDYSYSVLERAAQDLGTSGSRKYVNSDREWCSEFAVYALTNGGVIQDGWCSDPPRPMIDGDIGTADMADWFGSCGRRIDNVSTRWADMRPGYYLSVSPCPPGESRCHSVIFIDWVGPPGPGADFWL